MENSRTPIVFPEFFIIAVCPICGEEASAHFDDGFYEWSHMSDGTDLCGNADSYQTGSAYGLHDRS